MQKVIIKIYDGLVSEVSKPKDCEVVIRHYETDKGMIDHGIDIHKDSEGMYWEETIE